MSLHQSRDRLEKINAVSPSFCLAKWLQVTIDLVNGTTHSCHHPKRHSVPIEELENNPSALHNTKYKKEQRRKMLEGSRPAECSYCWDMEDLGNQYSDRYIKSTDSWAWDDLNRIAQMPWDADINPRYIEVMIDNICNFSCSYCLADISTGVAAEMEKYGPYPVSDPWHRMAVSKATKESRKPFVEAFEKWLPNAMKDLRVLRITGGEPLISATFWKLLTSLKTNSEHGLTFAVNSHLKHDKVIIEKFCVEIKTLLEDKKIGKFELYTSLDTYGAQAEYIRHGLEYQTVLKNIERVHSLIPNINIVIMCTFNILSISQFELLLEDIIQLRKRNIAVVLDVSYLKNPHYLRADMASAELIERLQTALNKMSSKESSFSFHEIAKVENLLNWVKSAQDPKLVKKMRTDFFKFINEYDKRKKKVFLDVFPEYRSFLIQCKQALFEEVGASS